MPSFVDESGTPGRKYPLSGLHFVVGCVAVPDEIILIDLLREFRRWRGWPARREIKFTELDHPQRLELLREMRQCEVRVTAAVVDKRAIKTPVSKLKSGELYKRSVAVAIAHSVRNTPTDHVTIDNYFDSKLENRNLVSYLRQTINGEQKDAGEKRVGDFSIEHSTDIAGLQVADVVAGAIADYYTDSNNVYRSFLKNILEECYWRENE